MSRFPSRLSRQELYSYGFKEGQPWRDDRRALESALRAMDQLERDTYENYIYEGSPTYSRNTGPRLPSPVPRHYLETHAAGRFPSLIASPYPQAIYSMNRSGSGSHSPSESSTAPWPDQGHSYRQGRSYHGYPGPSSRFNAQYERQGRLDISDDPANSPPPASDRRNRRNSSPQMSLNHPGQFIAPPLSSATTSYRSFNGTQGLVQRSSSRHSQAADAGYPLHGQNPLNTPLSPSRTQLVAYRADRGFPPGSDQLHTERRTSEYMTSPNDLPSGWSVATTRGTGSDSFSMDSSQFGHSEDTASLSSGYVESYDVHSHGEPYYQDYQDHDSDGSGADHDFMDGGAVGDESAYNFPSEGPEYDYDGHEVYSDTGYSSFSEGDESYGNSE